MTTYNGTRHYIDLDNMTAVRVAKGFDHEWTDSGRRLLSETAARH